VRRKLRPARVLGFLFSLLAACAVVSLSAVTWSRTRVGELQPSREARPGPGPAAHRALLSTDRLDDSNASADDAPVAMKWHGANGTFEMQGDYPPDLFTLAERRRGAVVVHMMGMLYMFIALAIVCDEFFVPALTVITEKLQISDDVAGATFMAAGGSAPELFTSLIGVFISHSNVGIGTIVGSAVFNILFVIGMCAIFSRQILNLTWWPLFRDVSFYIVGLVMLIIFFLDNKITYGESVGLLLCYSSYVTFMKFNSNMESFIKSIFNRNQVNELETMPKLESSALLSNASYAPYGEQSPGPGEDGTRLTTKPRLQRGGSSASLHNTLMRNSIFQLMIHTLDPLSEEFADSELGTYGKLKYYQTMSEEGKFREKASILHKMAKNKCQEDGDKANGVPGHTDKNLPTCSSVDVQVTPPMNGTTGQDPGQETGQETQSEEEEDEDQPLSLAWPETPRKRITYLLIFPIVFLLWVTLPDVRKESSRRFFPVTFLGAISWIAAFSYLMVWWAHQVGETIGITEEIMGLTILAAGTSIPDLITSVIVARKGLGDMAVSSSVGSNIFDITVGLPFPWLLYSLSHGLKPVTVSSNGLFCTIVLLFLMLVFVIISIASCKWRMSKLLGAIMFLLYLVFLVFSVLLEDKILECPVSI
ncbi:sodium/potassium/calcium exchanger 2-like, partial [Conger conger]|uniref:sodium/potassium/calcium exchanger 2-like n=1 Tax=Conger conger TaxID=82655 RepID=UPI002A5A5D9F